MKKMQKTIVTAVAMAACVGTQVFAQTVQNTKEDTITFAMTIQGQSSVSTSKTVPNFGNWSDGPKYYKTIKKKLTQVDILKYIAKVMHGNENFYSAKAKLVLVQGELSGFFNITPDLAASTANPPGGGSLDGTFDTDDTDPSTSLSNSEDSTYVRLATGNHFKPVPEGYATEGFFPPGHFQPWGQIFVKDPDRLGGICENVTFFFALTVEECYDCYFLNSFISDATFVTKTTTGTSGGPPCCTIPSSSQLFGKGTDLYYLTLSFDNSINNPYLDFNKDLYVGVEGLGRDSEVDGIFPDRFLGGYLDKINSFRVPAEPFKARFTLNGIVTYKWDLKFVNNSDLLPDFVGIAKYPFNGYGFVNLTCQFITGSAAFTEKIVKATGCCLDLPWYENFTGNDGWYGVGFDGFGNPYDSPFNSGPSLTYHVWWNDDYEPYFQASGSPE